MRGAGGVRRGPAGTLKCHRRAQNRWVVGVGPWQYQCSRLGGWEVGTRYSTHPVPTPVHHPGYHPCTAHRCTPPPTSTSRLARTALLDRSKEILGVGMHRGHAEAAARSRSALRPQLSGPLPGACTQLFSVYLNISQYFSVFWYPRLKVSQT